MKGQPQVCLVCGGSFATDQRRKHEATAKHQKGDQEMRSLKDTRPVPPPEVIEEHVKALNENTASPSEISEAQVAESSVAPANVVPFPATADALAVLEKAVKARAADVRWSEKHTDTDSAEKLAKRRAKLAEAEAALAAAKAQN